MDGGSNEPAASDADEAREHVAALGAEIPERVRVVIDSPRYSFIKRRDDGRVDFVGPLPSPYNYGSVPGTISGDGDRLDALVLGPRLPRGAKVDVPVRAVVYFVDAGEDDRKLICSHQRLRAFDRYALITFFKLYVPAKTLINTLRRRSGRTMYLGIEER